jgi:alanine racemase
MSRAEIVVDVAAIRHNVRRLVEFTQTPVMAVVKADGYGHGMIPAARAARAAGATWLGVATLDEALALRDAGDVGHLLCWLTVPGDDLAPAVLRGIDVTAYTLAELDGLAEAARRAGRKARVQLKIDTGLSRGGATAVEWPEVVARARAGEEAGSWTVTGIWSHFASSEVPEDPANEAQEKLFREALDVAQEAGLRPDVRHLANSAAAILRPSARFDLVRCGIASYGLDPAPGLSPADLDLHPAMTVRADLALVKHVAAGAAVSYNGRWVAPEPTTLGLVPVGYADGILRSAGNRAEVLVAGRRRPIRGSICMDQVVVDLGGDDPPPGVTAVIFGPGTAGEPTAQDWAEATGTISYEIVTRVGGRLTRRFVDSEEDAGHDTGHDTGHDSERKS